MTVEKTAQRRRMLQCRTAPVGAMGEYRYVVVCSLYQDQWLLSRHRKRDTWETQGGHIEAGEAPIQTARRELYEESGVQDAQIIPVCDYCGYDDYGHANGMVFLALVRSLGEMPESEMQEARLFQQLPDKLTYPDVTPRLIAEAQRVWENMQQR